MRLSSLLPIIVLLRGATCAGEWKRLSSTTPAETILTPDFVKSVQKAIDAENVPGLTLAIVRKTGSVELGAWGIKSEDGTNMTTDTLFNIASCSKAFLSASLGILIDDFAHGRNSTPLPAGLSTVTWKTKIADILPNDWMLMDPWASQKANLIDILTHVSGLASNDLSYKVNFSVSDVTRNLRNLRPSYELREQWLYNNMMYMVGAEVVSTLSGMRLADFVNHRIFKPLGMNSSTYSIDAATQTGKFSETWTSFGRLIPPWIENEFEDLIAGPGGVISSVEELASWVRMNLNGGINPDTNVTIIPSAAYGNITSVHSIVVPNTIGQPEGFSIEGYGLGWGRFSYFGHDIIQHGGGAPGVSASISLSLSDGIGIIVLANADSKDTVLEDITATVALKVFNTTSQPHEPSSASPTKREWHAGVTARANTTSAFSPLDLGGTYFNAGYDLAVLCSVLSSSPACRSVLADFRSVDPSLSPNSTDLFASWNGVFDKHIRFTQSNASQYSYLISIGTIYPHGYGKNSTAFATLSANAAAEFVVENNTVVGFGVNGIGDVVSGGQVDKDSDVWFVKVA